jgi:maltose/moltooligosaccharide transporter
MVHLDAFYGAASLLFFPVIQNQYLFFVVIIGYGIAWASMMGIPYLMVVANIPKRTLWSVYGNH